MPPSPPTDQTHHLRHFSAGLFLILFAFFSIQLALFTLAHSHSTSTPAILIALLIALYLALIPAAAAHGALSALASLAKESLTKYGLLPPPQPPSPTPTPVQEVQPEADHPVIHAIKVSTLGVPAMSHALANVCIRVVVESGVKVVWHWTPRVVSVCRSVVEYVVKVVQDVLPGLYPYLEKGVVFVVTWTPVLWRYGREGVVYAWRGLVVVSVWVGKVVHDAWDPVIVPLFLGLTALISDAVVGIRRVAELASKEAWRLLGVLHQWAEGVVTWGIEVSHWLNVILTPYWERVKAFGIWAANICGKVFETVSATIHSVAEQVVQLCIDWKVFEMMRHIVVGIVRLARVVKSWGVILSRWGHRTLEAIFTFIHNSKILTTIINAVRRTWGFLTPFAVRLSHNLYLIAIEIIAQTKLLAAPLISAILSFAGLLTKWTHEVIALIIATQWFKLLQQFAEWQIWKDISAWVEVKVVEMTKTVSRVVEDMERRVMKLYGEAEKRVSEWIKAAETKTDDVGCVDMKSSKLKSD